MAKNKDKKEKHEINDGHYVEFLDRTHVVMMNIVDHLVEHPLAQRKKKIRKKLRAAVTILADVYQNIGQYNVISLDENYLKDIK